MERVDRDRLVKMMARLMQAGAVMLDSTCPVCGSPLFRLRNGDIVCPIHGRVHVVSSEREVSLVRAANIVRGLIDHAARKIESLVEHGGDPREIDAWLGILEKAVRVERDLKGKEKGEVSSGSSRGSARRTAQG